MVAQRSGQVSFTALEVAVFRSLVEHGEVETGSGTIAFRRRRRNAADAAEFGPDETVQQVDHKTAKRLAKSGLVQVVHGMASITDEGRAALEAAEAMPPA